MKQITPYFLILFCCLIFPPVFITYFGGHSNKDILLRINTLEQEPIEYDELLKEQIIGILAKEVDYKESLEYVKTNAVMIRTYLLRRQLGQTNLLELIPLNQHQMKERFGDDYETAYKIYEAAVQSTQDEVIYYEDALIEPVYHIESGGKTRDAKDYYEREIGYLKAVDSPSDVKTKQTQYTIEQAIDLLKSSFPEIIISAQYFEQQVQIVELDKSGYIKKIQFGSISLNEKDFLKIFGLVSSNVEISFNGDKINFLQKGEGSGVGLSQNGAKEFAKKGSTYKDILNYYYSEIKIKKNNE
ncbi:hypothetical protein AN641_05305 [Candidatus Epulonipiscioides gigas]|nr:hypothetical protein AN641_05305 [Epulopiscium sp. SCG-C07WGA-EpuloA2]